MKALVVIRPDIASWGAALLTAVASVAICWGTAFALGSMAVRLLGKSSAVDVGLGMVLYFYWYYMFPAVALSAAIANVALAEKARRWGAGLAGVTAVCVVAFVVYLCDFAPNWAMLVVASTLSGIVIPNVAADWVRRRCARARVARDGPATGTDS